MKFWRFRLFSYQIVIIVLVVLLAGVVSVGSLHLYDYTEHDPKFCVSCHIMNEAFVSWETSIHKGVECHDCHYATILERNKMLLETLFKKPEKVADRPHEKIIVPSAMCIQCHWKGEKKITKISDSTGHAMHWFKGSMECASCHAVTLHKFEPEQKLCLNCHPNGKLALAGMKDMLCADCHNFRKGNLVPKKKDCLACHADLEDSEVSSSGSLAHTRFECNTCHRAHDPEKPATTLCQNCHRLTMKRGKHPVHLEAIDGNCLNCHQPHSWTIPQNEAKKLCSQCHAYYPLKKFG